MIGAQFCCMFSKLAWSVSMIKLPGLRKYSNLQPSENMEKLLFHGYDNFLQQEKTFVTEKQSVALFQWVCDCLLKFLVQLKQKVTRKAWSLNECYRERLDYYSFNLENFIHPFPSWWKFPDCLILYCSILWFGQLHHVQMSF